MNLFVCYTPFHIRLAGEIIKKEGLSNCVFICFFTDKSEKNLYHYSKAERLADKGSYFCIKRNSPLDIIPLLSLISKVIFNLKGEFTFYTGNVKTFYSRLFLLFSRNYTLKTFDDGAGNISRKGYLYDDDSESTKRILKFIGFQRLLYHELVSQIRVHYTVYTNPNVYPNTSYLSFFSPAVNTISNKPAQKLNILLTSPLSEDDEMTLEEEIKIYRHLILKFDITTYIRHPRERKQLKIEANIAASIESNDVAEDIILRLLDQYELNVYGLYSSVLLNLQQNHRLKLFNVHYISKYDTTGLEQIFSELNIPTLR